MSQSMLDKEERACMSGYILEMGPLAYTGRLDASEANPKVGDHVTFVRYAGNRDEDGPDGEHYRTINDEDVINVLRTEEKAK